MRETPLPPKKMAESSGRELRADGSREVSRPVSRDLRSAHGRPDHGPVSDRYEERICAEYWLG